MKDVYLIQVGMFIFLSPERSLDAHADYIDGNAVMMEYPRIENFRLIFS